MRRRVGREHRLWQIVLADPLPLPECRRETVISQRGRARGVRHHEPPAAHLLKTYSVVVKKPRVSRIRVCLACRAEWMRDMCGKLDLWHHQALPAGTSSTTNHSRARAG